MMAKRVPDSFWVTQLRQIHRHIRERVLAELRGSQAQHMAEVVAESHADVIFAIDRIADEAVLWGFENFLGRDLSFILISEGLPGEGKRPFPMGTDFQSAAYCIIVDPIDGTRPLMFDKRSGWILTAVAANRGPATGLQDIFFAIQTEIPFSRQDWADCLWAFKGQPARAIRENLLTGEEIAYTPRASTAQSLDQGFGSFVHFFHGSKEIISRIDEAVAKSIFGPVQKGKARVFEDQYMSTGGQVYELATGRDRFLADLRAIVEKLLQQRGEALGLCCHPYDICTALIARSAGAVITDARGESLRASLDITTNVNWIGYANPRLRQTIEPVLQTVLREMGLLS